MENALKKVGEHLPDAPLSPAVSVAAISLQMALQFLDVNTVKDGSLYQQYKLDQVSMVPASLDTAFDIAKQIEKHLMESSNRISDLIFEQVLEGLDVGMGEEVEQPVEGGDNAE